MSVLRDRQVVTSEVRTLACTPVGPVIATRDQVRDESPQFRVEGSPHEP